MSVGYGTLGKFGDLGYNEGSNRKVVVCGTASLHGISMHPPANADGKVRVFVLCQYTLCATIATALIGFTARPLGDVQSYASASYVLSKRYERIAGAVAINDDVILEKLRDEGSPVRGARPLYAALRPSCEAKRAYGRAFWLDFFSRR